MRDIARLLSITERATQHELPLGLPTQRDIDIRSFLGILSQGNEAELSALAVTLESGQS